VAQESGSILSVEKKQVFLYFVCDWS